MVVGRESVMVFVILTVSVCLGLLGRMAVPKRMNFRKSSKGGGRGRGSFSIQKFILQLLDFYTGL